MHEAGATMDEASAGVHETGADGADRSHFKAGSDRKRSKARNSSESGTAEVSRRHRTRDDGLSHDHMWSDRCRPDDRASHDGPTDDNARPAN
jgi:hypothetical protein